MRRPLAAHPVHRTDTKEPLFRLVELERVGQDDAVEAVSNAIRRSRTGLADPDRPIGQFLFLKSAVPAYEVTRPTAVGAGVP